MSTVSSSTAASTAADTQSLLQQAAQSVISGSTGNTSLDVTQIVSALVAAKVAGQTDAITTQTQNDTAQISAWGSLQAALSALQIALTPLSNGSTVNKFAATASGDGLTATAGTGAIAGSYQIGVQQIAAGQVLTSQAYGAKQALGTGTLTISVGGKSMDVPISSSANKVTDIAAAINSASNNPGVSATVVNGADGAHLVLHATNSGAANAISVSVNETDGGSTLKTLAVTSTAGTAPTVTNSGGTSTLNSNGSTIAAGSSWTQSTAGQDAYFTVDGTAVTSATNSVTTALTGITLNLTSAAISDTPQTLTIAQDTTSQATDITNFVQAYNSLVTAIGTATGFDSNTHQATGTLIGDPLVNQLNNTLSSILASAVGTGSGATGLGALGISLNADGTLAVDNDTLTTALATNQAAVSQLFNSTNGIAAQLNNTITAETGTSGAITNRVAALNSDLTGTGPNSVPTETDALNTYKAQLTTMYTAQFTALNNLMAQMNNNSQYLTALFGGQNSQGALSANK